MYTAFCQLSKKVEVSRRGRVEQPSIVREFVIVRSRVQYSLWKWAGVEDEDKVSNLVFYAQSTITVISGRMRTKSNGPSTGPWETPKSLVQLQCYCLTARLVFTWQCSCGEGLYGWPVFQDQVVIFIFLPYKRRERKRQQRFDTLSGTYRLYKIIMYAFWRGFNTTAASRLYQWHAGQAVTKTCLTN